MHPQVLAELDSVSQGMIVERSNVRIVRIVRVRSFVDLVLVLGAGIAGAAQFQRALVRGQRIANDGDFDGRFNFCRLVYDGNRNGGSWQTDYPNADINMSIRFSELTKTRVAFYPSGEPKHLLVRATADSLFKCPFVILTAPGSAIFDDDEVKALRTYLDKGGFIWADDFWGTTSGSSGKASSGKSFRELSARSSTCR